MACLNLSDFEITDGEDDGAGGEDDGSSEFGSSEFGSSDIGEGGDDSNETGGHAQQGHGRSKGHGVDALMVNWRSDAHAGTHRRAL